MRYTYRQKDNSTEEDEDSCFLDGENPQGRRACGNEGVPLVDDKILDHLCTIYWNLNDIAMELIEGWRDLQGPLDRCVDLVVLISWQRRCQAIAVHIQTTIEFLTMLSDTRIPERTNSGWLDRFESIAKRIVRMKPLLSFLAKECEERMVIRHERTGLKQGKEELNGISSTLSNIKISYEGRGKLKAEGCQQGMK